MCTERKTKDRSFCKSNKVEPIYQNGNILTNKKNHLRTGQLTYLHLLTTFTYSFTNFGFLYYGVMYFVWGGVMFCLGMFL